MGTVIRVQRIKVVAAQGQVDPLGLGGAHVPRHHGQEIRACELARQEDQDQSSRHRPGQDHPSAPSLPTNVGRRRCPCEGLIEPPAQRLGSRLNHPLLAQEPGHHGLDAPCLGAVRTGRDMGIGRGPFARRELAIRVCRGNLLVGCTVHGLHSPRSPPGPIARRD